MLLFLLAGLSTLLTGWVLTGVFQQQLREELAGEMETRAQSIRDQVPLTDDWQDSATSLARQWSHEFGYEVTLLDSRGLILGSSRSHPRSAPATSLPPEIAGAIEKGKAWSFRPHPDTFEGTVFVAIRINPGRSADGLIRLGSPVTMARDVEGRIRPPLLFLALFWALLSGGLGWQLSRSWVRRLRVLGATADSATQKLDAPSFRDTKDDEIGDLARSLGRMAEENHRRMTHLTGREEQLRLILDRMVEGVIVTDASGKILIANPAFGEIFGVEGNLAGRRPVEVARAPTLQQAVNDVLETRLPVAREIHLAGDRERTILANLSVLEEDEGTSGAVAVFHDVTELKALEKVRRDFITNVSHELRTPLTAIRGYAETLKEGGSEEPAQTQNFAEVISRNARRLQELIDDLLNLSAVEQGQVRLDLGPVALADIFNQVEGLIRPLAWAKHQSLEMAGHDAPLSIRADKTRLGQVLINLLENAVKFTPEGGHIALSAEKSGDQVLLRVQDTGVGIPPQEVSRVFERFYRVDPSRDRREGGTGLGLAIAKHLAQSMGGNLEVESSSGSGTTFLLTLPTPDSTRAV